MTIEEGYLKEKCMTGTERAFYKCPFEEEYYEILQKFPCNTIPSLINDTTGLPLI